jgi:hypothetical protein
MLALIVASLTGDCPPALGCSGRIDLRARGEWCSSPARNSDPVHCVKH